jgi:hypothetical protein
MLLLQPVLAILAFKVNKEPTSSSCHLLILFTELPEESFVTCTSCEDYDLCIPCHVDNKHGHHPKHGFTPAVEDTNLEPIAQALLAPGRNSGHNAICDGCDKVSSNNLSSLESG